METSNKKKLSEMLTWPIRNSRYALQGCLEVSTWRLNKWPAKLSYNYPPAAKILCGTWVQATVF
ncbi:hypothetical protein M514_03461 [Trichuris suis]|uniref:Uncharacterized protein n=1 Tax=Trichuris suis TaxID=68888 RepID=A0A085NDQ4_9BILA|nr:hypothetical protein M513_03461 [Trichuris suis]KFD67600.1 hypothetical protein M514_03461 [Trichuris suis]